MYNKANRGTKVTSEDRNMENPYSNCKMFSVFKNVFSDLILNCFCQIMHLSLISSIRNCVCKDMFDEGKWLAE